MAHLTLAFSLKCKRFHIHSHKKLGRRDDSVLALPEFSLQHPPEALTTVTPALSDLKALQNTITSNSLQKKKIYSEFDSFDNFTPFLISEKSKVLYETTQSIQMFHNHLHHVYISVKQHSNVLITILICKIYTYFLIVYVI